MPQLFCGGHRSRGNLRPRVKFTDPLARPRLAPCMPALTCFLAPHVHGSHPCVQIMFTFVIYNSIYIPINIAFGVFKPLGQCIIDLLRIAAPREPDYRADLVSRQWGLGQ